MIKKIPSAESMAEIRDKWLEIGLSTEPADRERAVKGVNFAYKEAKLDPPNVIVWLQSPLSGAIGASLLSAQVGAQVEAQVRDQVGAQVRAQVRDQVWDQAGDQVEAQVETQVGDQVWDQVGAQVEDQVWDQVGAQVRDQVGDQVGAQVRDQVGDQVGAQVRDQVGDQVGAQVEAQVGDQVGAQVWDQVGAQVWDQVRAQVRDQVRAQVRDQVGAQVWDQVGDQVGAQVRDQVGAQVWDQVSYSLWGQQDYWLSFYDFFLQNHNLKTTKRLIGLMEVAQSSGWWWAFRNTVILTERPTILTRDQENRLHNDSGAALLYPDGWGIWSWHGVRVPQEVIEKPETITAEQIIKEPNTEIRRAMLEKVGAERLLNVAKKVHKDDYGTLLRIDQRDDEPIVLVKVVNSTPEPDGSLKDYILRVPPQMQTAREAVAWTFDVPEEEYQVAVET